MIDSQDMRDISSVLKGHARFLGPGTHAILTLDIGKALGFEGDLMEEWIGMCNPQEGAYVYAGRRLLDAASLDKFSVIEDH